MKDEKTQNARLLTFSFLLIASTAIAAVVGFFLYQSNLISQKLELANLELETSNKEITQQKITLEQLAIEANAANQKSLLTQSRIAALEAERLIKEGELGSAIALTLAVLPHDQNRPTDKAAELQLRSAIYKFSEKKVFHFHDSEILFLSASKRNDVFVTVFKDRKTIAWNSRGSVKFVINDHNKDITALNLSDDGNYFALGLNDGTVRVWNLDGENISTLVGHDNSINAISFLKDNKHLVTASDDHTARVWLVSGKLVSILEGHGGSI
ncbi:MAG: hypothetical protein AAF903_07735 [Pseudomonadota bacterium]